MKHRRLTVGIFTLALLILAVAQFGLAQEIRQIYVQGEGVVQVEPDRAYISLGVTTEAPSAEEAQIKNANSMRNILAALGELGIKDDAIETSYFNVYPIYRYDQEKGNQLTGYRVSNTVSVTLDDLSQVGEAIDSAIKAGATNVNSVNFTLADEKPWLNEAMVLAVENARQKAELLTAAAGVKLGPVMAIRDPSTQFQPYSVGKEMRMMTMAAAGDASSVTPITPGKLEIRAVVEMVYALD
ncbi:MAG: SIMPL domain-containing protein [Firmicutes bacterium]|nr:SIMPL domain-containing protein [Bacillota bacterium]